MQPSGAPFGFMPRNQPPHRWDLRQDVRIWLSLAEARVWCLDCKTPFSLDIPCRRIRKRISSASAETLNTWAMLLVGFLGLGYAARPRRKKSQLGGLTASHVPEA